MSVARPTAFRGGPVITMDEAGTVHSAGSALLCEQGRIQSIAALEPGLDGAETNGAQSIDFGSERPLLPAFLDVHAHLGMTTMALANTVDCHTPPRMSIEEIVEAMRADISLSEARGGWLVGLGSLFHDRKLSDGRLPTRDDLDRVSETVPIALRCGGHVTVLNSRALELADLGSQTLPEGARVDVDGGGRATGVLRELYEYLPIPAATREQRKRDLCDIARQLFTANGVTYIGEISQTVEDVECTAELVAAGEIKASIDVYTWVPATLPLQEAIRWAKEHDGDGSALRMRGIKVFADGGFSAGTAAVKRPYRGSTDNLGDLTIGEQQMSEILRSCREAGLQLIAHTNGERAQDSTCRAVLATVGREQDSQLRTRLEHGGNFVSEPETVELWRQAGVACVAQPGFLYTLGDFFPDYLGDYAQAGRFPFRWLRDEGFLIAGSSDLSGSEVRQANPFFNAWCAVERRGFGGESIGAEQALSVTEALEMQTRIAADAAGVLAERGSLEHGKVGDIAVLDRDPRSLTGQELAEVHVDFLVRDGEVIYSREGAAPFEQRVA